MTRSSPVDWTAREATARQQRRDHRRQETARRLARVLRLLSGVALSFVLSAWGLSQVTHVSLLWNPPRTHIRLFTDHLGIQLAGEFAGAPHRLPWLDFRLARWDESYTACGWEQIFRNPPPRGDRWSTRVLGDPWLAMIRMDHDRSSAVGPAVRARLGVRYGPLLLALGLVYWYCARRCGNAAAAGSDP